MWLTEVLKIKMCQHEIYHKTDEFFCINRPILTNLNLEMELINLF